MVAQVKGGLESVSGSHMFPGGVHPLEGLNGKAMTGGSATQPITPAPSRVVIPMQQHIGTPCRPTVKPGDKVKMGQLIGEAEGFISAPIHASVSGTVISISPCMLPNGQQADAIVIDNDFQDEWAKPMAIPEINQLDANSLAQIARDAGIVGMGGAMFPTSVKLLPPEGTEINTLIINGAECEPYLTADHRLMLEYSDELVDGIEIILGALKIQKAIIGIEDNKKDAIALLNQKVQSHPNITVKELPVMYPQGGEKQLVYAITKRKVPRGGLPSAIGCLVTNVATVTAIFSAVRKGRPLIERIVTVGGYVNNPGNFLVKIGTTVDDLIDAAGGLLKNTKKLIYGGPMMGMAISRKDITINKGCSGIVALGNETISAPESNCIRCGRCGVYCPMKLMPMLIDQNVRRERYEECEKLYGDNCIECGICSFVCPAKRHLTQSCKVSRAAIANLKRQAIKAQESAAPSDNGTDTNTIKNNIIDETDQIDGTDGTKGEA